MLHFHQFQDQHLEKLLQMWCLNSLHMKLTVTQKVIKKKKNPEKHQSKWDPVSVNEMKTYIGLCVLQ